MLFPAAGRQFQRFDNGPAGATVARLVGPENSRTMAAGLVRFERCAMDWAIPYDEVMIVGDGKLDIGMAGKTFALGPSDAVWLPRGARFHCGGEGASETFWALYPADYHSRPRPAGGLPPIDADDVRLFPAASRVFSAGAVRLARLVGPDISDSCGAGVAEIDRGAVESKTIGDEVLYGLAGSLRLDIDGTAFEIGPGDAFWLPAGSAVTYRAAGRARIFYGVHPATGLPSIAGPA